MIFNKFKNYIFIIVIYLVLPSTVVAQYSTQIETSRGDIIDLDNPNQQLKYILSNEFAKIITGNTFAGLGNYAAISTTDNTLSGQLNKVYKNSVLGIKVGGGLTDGVSTLFENKNINTNITLGLTYNLLLTTPKSAVNVLELKKIEDKKDALEKKFIIDSTKALAFQVLQIEKIKAKKYEINELDRKISERQNPQNTNFYLKQSEFLEYDLKTLINERLLYRENLDSILIEIKRKYKGEKQKLETLRAEAFEFDFEKKIKAKEKELKEISQELENRVPHYDPIEDLAKRAILEKELEILHNDLNSWNDQMEIVSLRYEKDLNLLKVGAEFDLIEPDNLKFKWFTIGGDISQNSFDLYNSTNPENEKIKNTKDITPSFTLAYSGLLSTPIIGSNRRSRHSKFYSLGLNGKLGNNINDLEKVEVITTQIISSSQSLVTKKNVYIGDFDKSKFSILFFADYYQFIGTRNNIGFHLRSTIDISSNSKNVSSFRGGLVIPFTKKDDLSSIVNLEFFVGINDIFNKIDIEGLYNQTIVGIQTTFPISFKTL